MPDKMESKSMPEGRGRSLVAVGNAEKIFGNTDVTFGEFITEFKSFNNTDD
jgi:hypothetical protein